MCSSYFDTVSLYCVVLSYGFTLYLYSFHGFTCFHLLILVVFSVCVCCYDLFYYRAAALTSIVFVSFFFFKQKPAYEMRIVDWISDVCSSDLMAEPRRAAAHGPAARQGVRAGVHQRRFGVVAAAPQRPGPPARPPRRPAQRGGGARAALRQRARCAPCRQAAVAAEARSPDRPRPRLDAVAALRHRGVADRGADRRRGQHPRALGRRRPGARTRRRGHLAQQRDRAALAQRRADRTAFDARADAAAELPGRHRGRRQLPVRDRKSTRLNSSH